MQTLDSDHPTPLVSTEWLAEHLRDPRVVVLDSSYHLPTVQRDAETEFEGLRIPGARFFDFDGRIKDQDAQLAHMLPSPGRFAAEVGALGVSNDSFVVAYDVMGMFSAARCWWMFRTFGHDAVAVLDGGLPKWERDGRPVEMQAPPDAWPSAEFHAHLRRDLVRSASQVMGELDSAEIVDARSSGRYHGTEPEPRPGLRSGHIPGAASVPFQSLLAENGAMRETAELRSLFETAGVDLSRPITASCGSGVTACNLALALKLLGRDDVAVYDGSWSEWGAQDALPIETG